MTPQHHQRLCGQTLKIGHLSTTRVISLPLMMYARFSRRLKNCWLKYGRKRYFRVLLFPHPASPLLMISQTRMLDTHFWLMPKTLYSRTILTSSIILSKGRGTSKTLCWSGKKMSDGIWKHFMDGCRIIWTTQAASFVLSNVGWSTS